MYRNIVLAADGSEFSIRAAEQAAYIAKLGGSELQIVYVINEDAVESEILENWNHVDDLQKKRAEKLKPIEDKMKAAGIRYEVKFLRGDPGPVIVQYCNDNKIDLAVLGSRGLNALQELVLGSVSHKVAKRADCPVLIVK